MAQGFQIISSRLFTAQVCVDAHVPGSSGQGFSFSVWDMLFRLRIAILLGHAKVNHVNNICCFGTGPADEKVVGFDVAVDQVLLVYGLDSRKLQGS